MLLANAFAQQQAGRFPWRGPAEVAWPESELLTPARPSEASLAGEMGSTDSFLEQLQDFLDQAEPESGVLELDPPAAADPHDGSWLEEAPPIAEPLALPQHGTGEPARENEAKGAAMAEPPRIVEAAEAAAQAPVPREAGRPPKARPTRAAGWRYAVLAVLTGCVLGIMVARQEGKAGPLRTAAAVLPQSPSPQGSALSEAPAAQRASAPVLISDITSSTASGSAQVSIALQGPVQYHAYRLHNPERLYFDLQNTDLASPLVGRSVALERSLVRKIRSAQRGPNVSRVTLETEGRCKYQASIVPDPYRLIIELQARPSARK